MSSDNILLNEHALNSLKRAQLVALCKRYELRANGKNNELIARLEEFGHRSSTPGPSSSEMGAGSSTGAKSRVESLKQEAAPRVSEAWSVVDEPEEGEAEAAMPGSFAPSKEFGGGNPSVKSTSVSSSFKLLAASLFPSSSSRTKASTAPTEMDIPPPHHTDIPELPRPASIMDIDELLPRGPSTPDPEPEDDLPLPETNPDYQPMDLGASTIRLVGQTRDVKSPSPPSSPEYANPSPFKGKSPFGLPPSSSHLHLPLPSADLFSSRSGGGFSKSTPAELFASSSRYGANKDKEKPLYPTVRSFKTFTTATSDSLSIPGNFPEPPPRSYPAYANSPPKAKAEGIPTTMDPNFTFRAPLPPSTSKLDPESKEETKAAVIAEMRRRMAEEKASTYEDGSGEFSFVAVPGASGGMAKKRAREEEDDEEGAGGSGDGNEGTPGKLKAKFDDAHRKQFDKMASIADHYAARRPTVPAQGRRSGLAPGPRRSSNSSVRVRASLAGNRAGPKRLSTAAQRMSAVQATAPRPSRLAGDDRPGKRARLSTAPDIDAPALQSPTAATLEPPQPTFASPRVRISDTTPIQMKAAANPNAIDVTAQTKRKVEIANANARRKSKTRSSTSRQSLSRNAVLGSGHQPAKPKGFASRFGFLKSSAKLVKSVYTSVVGNGAPEASASTTGAKNAKPAPSNVKPTAAASAPAKVAPAKTSANAAASSSSGANPVPAADSSAVAARGVTRKASNASRPGLPSWDKRSTGAGAARASMADSVSSRRSQVHSHSRTPSLTGPGTANSLARTSSIAGTGTNTPASSIGLKRASSTRSSAGFAAPTISSLNRAKAAASSSLSHPSTSTQAQAGPLGLRQPSISSRKALLDTVPEQGQASTSTAGSPRASRPLPTPNKFGFVGGLATSPAKSSATPRSTFSPLSATAASSPHAAPGSPSAPLTFANFTFSPNSPLKRGSAASPSKVLSPRENVEAAVLDGDKTMTPSKAGKSSTKEIEDFVVEDGETSTSTILPRSNSYASHSTASSSLRKRPRISRSKVIARLEEKRAAEDAASKGPVVHTLRTKTRSSVGVGLAKGEGSKVIPARRSFVGAGAGVSASPRAAKERAVLDSWQKGKRRSEAIRRRSSRAPLNMNGMIAE